MTTSENKQGTLAQGVPFFMIYILEIKSALVVIRQRIVGRVYLLLCRAIGGDAASNRMLKFDA